MGTISLYNEKGTRISFMRYDSKTKRRYILDYWRNFYGYDRFKKFFYQIEPDTYDIKLKYKYSKAS